MELMPHRYETESPFYDLVDAAGNFARSPSQEGARNRLQELVLQCRISAGLSLARMEELGVSSDLVFRFDLLLAQLERVEALLRVISGEEDGRVFGALLVRAFSEERGVHSLLRNSVNRGKRDADQRGGRYNPGNTKHIGRSMMSGAARQKPPTHEGQFETATTRKRRSGGRGSLTAGLASHVG